MNTEADSTVASRVRELQELQEKLGVAFPSFDLLEVALTHPSYLGEASSGHTESNQRLEFLGDSLLGLAVSEYLYNRYAEFPEGELTKIKAAVVSEATLHRVAQRVSLGRYLLLGRGEEASGGRSRPSVLADAFEAVVGAVLVEVGTDPARQFVLRHLAEEIEAQSNAVGQEDYKSRLQELTQSRSQGTPTYQVVDEQGPDHRKTFVVEVSVEGKPVGTGRGSSKKEAEQNAAHVATNRLEDRRPRGAGAKPGATGHGGLHSEQGR